MQSADLNLTSTVTGYQRFIFVRLPEGAADLGLAEAIGRLGANMENMHYVEGPPSPDAFRMGRFQYLRVERSKSLERDIPHPAVMDADGLVRLEAETLEPLLEYEAGLRALLGNAGGSLETLPGVQKPRSYTSHAMTQYAYARAQQPGPGSAHSFGVVTPMNKSTEWWAMDWMHRESFFLPRYDTNENMVVKGHALAADAGVACITRRLVHSSEGYGNEGCYDFVGYFEFAESDTPTFNAVMAALRDTEQNPEWKYISEGPEWWGRRVGESPELWVQK